MEPCTKPFTKSHSFHTEAQRHQAIHSCPPAFLIQKMNRRNFLQTAALTSSAATLPAIEPFRRNSHKFSGLSLTSYSMKPHMKWWWGKEREEGKMDILGFWDYCAELELDAAEITSYFFPDQLTLRYINEVKRRAHINGLDISGAAMGNNFGNKPGSPENVSDMQYFRKWIDSFADMGATVVRVFASKKIPPGQSDEQTIHYVTANLSPTPFPYMELERIAPYAVTAQIKVMTKVNGEDVPADYSKMLNILRRANYRGYIVFEYEEDEDPYAAIPPHVKQLRRLM